MTTRTFDREIRYDDRSLEYPIRTALPSYEARSYTWRHVQTDQGQEGACVGHAVTMEAAARPKTVFGDPLYEPPPVGVLNSTAFTVYKDAQQIDEWEGESYSGTSVLAGMKVGRQRGWWSEYRWALGPGPAAAAHDVILALGYRGPVIMGTWWWSGMYEADADGYLRRTGHRVGGHAYLLTSYNKKRDAVWTPNSWGGAGQGWITHDDLTALLGDQGEGAIPTIRHK